MFKIVGGPGVVFGGEVNRQEPTLPTKIDEALAPVEIALGNLPLIFKD